jgi:hypothetical protein
VVPEEAPDTGSGDHGSLVDSRVELYKLRMLKPPRDREAKVLSGHILRPLAHARCARGPAGSPRTPADDAHRSPQASTAGYPASGAIPSNRSVLPSRSPP